MKLLIISDVHSCIEALDAVWERESDSDVILCAGDMIDWGWNPHEVIAWMREHNTICVLGNHEIIVRNYYDKEEREPVGMETTYASQNANAMTEEDIEWVRKLPRVQVVEYDGITYCMRHTSSDSWYGNAVLESVAGESHIPNFDILWDKFANVNVIGERRFIFGHSHICSAVRAGAHEMYLNPGSLQYRLNANSVLNGADYIVVNNGIPELRHVSYSTEKVYENVKNSNFTEDVKKWALIYASGKYDN